MYTVMLALHVFVCVLLIVAVLIQPSKTGDLSSAFGGGVATDVFGPGAPANLMTRITTVIAACFLLLSLALALMVNQRSGNSILQNFQPNMPIQEQQNVPAMPMTPPAQSLPGQ